MDLVDLIRGRVSLSKTFWVWAVVGTFLVKFLWNALFAVTIPNHVDATGHTLIVYGSTFVVLGWSIIAAIAVFNSAGHSGRRTVWGWIASAIAIAGISVPLYISAGLMLGSSRSWDDIETDVGALVEELPVQVSENLILSNIRSNPKDQSVTFVLDFEEPSLTHQNFDRKTEVGHVLAYCDRFAHLLYYPTETVRFVFHADDGSRALVITFPSDCDIKIYNLGPSQDFLPRAFYFQARW